jgi:hypothetical protein
VLLLSFSFAIGNSIANERQKITEKELDAIIVRKDVEDVVLVNRLVRYDHLWKAVLARACITNNTQLREVLSFGAFVV